MAQIVETARENLRRSVASMAQSKLPSIGARWGTYSDQIRAVANSTNDPLIVIRTAQEWQGSFESRHAADALTGYAADLDAIILSEYPEYEANIASFAESDTAPMDKVAFSNGRKVSSPVLNQTRTVLRGIKTARPNVVLDIGGGTGSTGRLWMTNTVHRPRRYIDLDLPESLFFAETYLRHTLPDVDVIYLHNIIDVLRCAIRSTRKQVVLVPAHKHYLTRWLGADLVTNTGSLQEMTTEYVDHYMDVIDKTSARYFYSANYFAQKIEVLVESMNYAAPTLPSHWKARALQWWPDEFRGVAEVVYERTRNADGDIHDVAATPRNQAEFLKLFDTLRHTNDANELLSAVERTMSALPYVPKELLYLARRAKSLSPRDPSIAKCVADLETLAAVGVANFGMVGSAPPELAGTISS